MSFFIISTVFSSAFSAHVAFQILSDFVFKMRFQHSSKQRALQRTKGIITDKNKEVKNPPKQTHHTQRYGAGIRVCREIAWVHFLITSQFRLKLEKIGLLSHHSYIRNNENTDTKLSHVPVVFTCTAIWVPLQPNLTLLFTLYSTDHWVWWGCRRRTQNPAPPCTTWREHLRMRCREQRGRDHRQCQAVHHPRWVSHCETACRRVTTK